VPCSTASCAHVFFKEIEMKHTKIVAALATAGSLFAATSAHAFIPAIAAGVAAMAGVAATGTAMTNKQNNPPALAAAPATPATVAVAPNSTVVMGAGPVQQVEVIPAPREGYHWDRGHYEIRDGVTTWVDGRWLAN
jgi:hypothetical protein